MKSESCLLLAGWPGDFIFQLSLYSLLILFTCSLQFCSSWAGMACWPHLSLPTSCLPSHPYSFFPKTTESKSLSLDLSKLRGFTIIKKTKTKKPLKVFLKIYLSSCCDKGTLNLSSSYHSVLRLNVRSRVFILCHLGINTSVLRDPWYKLLKSEN